MENLTWKCGICGKERPDECITVRTYFLKDLPGAEGNLKYCNDDTNCIVEAIRKSKTNKL